MANTFQKNVVNSFGLVRRDIQNLSDHIRYLYSEIDRLKIQLATVTAAAAQKNEKKNLVASKTGKKVHNSACTFGKRIKASNLICFSNKADAERQGFKPCSCLA